MMTIPAILYPVLALIAAIVVGRIGTIIMDQFRKDEISVEAARLSSTGSVSHENAMGKNTMVKHG